MRIVLRIFASIVITAMLIYAADATWVRIRIANHNNPTGSVLVRVMLAVPQKNGRVEYIPGGSETETCVQALFPHGELQPCWYLRRHTRKQVSY